MKLWSRGLGTTELDMDFRCYKVMKDPNSKEVWICGQITDPVNWEFKMKLYPEDLGGLIKVFLSGSILWLGAKNCWRYFEYFFNKKKYIQYKDGIDIVDKVNKAYEQMHRRSSRASRSERKAAKSETAGE